MMTYGLDSDGKQQISEKSSRFRRGVYKKIAAIEDYKHLTTKHPWKVFPARQPSSALITHTGAWSPDG